MTGLEEIIRACPAHAFESQDAICSFVRGSAVSSWDGGFRQAHPSSDIDLVVLSDRYPCLNQYTTQVKDNGNVLKVAVDVKIVNARQLEREIDSPDRSGVRMQFSFVHDSHPIANPEFYFHYRRLALQTFLRIGLPYYGDVASLTPSGAMYAINQGKLIVNPLRWWSIQYAFQQSPTAQHNIARYYQDVCEMCHSQLVRTGKHGGEEVYAVPDGFAIPISPRLWFISYVFNTMIERLRSHPMVSSNDVQKLFRKFQSMVIGALNGHSDMDRIFQNAPALSEHGTAPQITQ